MTLKLEEAQLCNNYSTELQAVLVTQLARAHTTQPQDREFQSTVGTFSNINTMYLRMDVLHFLWTYGSTATT